MEENKDLTFAQKLLGNDGLKFSITANLAPQTYMNLGLLITGSIFIGSALVLITKKMVGK